MVSQSFSKVFPTRCSQSFLFTGLGKGFQFKAYGILGQETLSTYDTPIYSNKVKKGLNPNIKVSDKAGGCQKIFHEKMDKAQSTLSNANNKDSFWGKRSVTDCGSVTSGSVAMNTLIQQGIPTSNKFAALMEGSWEDDSVSFQDDLSADSCNSHINSTTPTRTIVSVTSRSPRLPTGSDLKNHVELPQCQPLCIGKTYDIHGSRKTSFKGNKNKTGFLDQGSKQSLAYSIRCDLDANIQQLSPCTDNIGHLIRLSARK